VVERTGVYGVSTIWLTGVSGAGKSTAARAISAELRRRGRAVVELHGDDLRDVLDDHRFDIESRRGLAEVYARLCRLLAEQGLDVVIATISLFNAVHEWNREHVPGYIEVVLRADPDDRPGADIVGRDQQAEFPASPDFVFDHFPSEEDVKMIVDYAMTKEHP